MPIRAQRLTFGQTLHLKLKTSLICSIVYKNYAILFTALENQVFCLFKPYLALIIPKSDQTGLKFDFYLNFQI